MIKALIARAIAKHGAKKLMLMVIGEIVKRSKFKKDDELLVIGKIMKRSKSKKDDEIFAQIQDLAKQL